jgi:PKD repeat protein
MSENEYDTFEFIFGDGTQSELLERNSPQPIIHEYAISGTYYVTLRIYNDLGCLEELTKTIKVGKGYSILVPNVFTPNGDIWNNISVHVFNGLSEITLRIYDAQGGLLYEELGLMVLILILLDFH